MLNSVSYEKNVIGEIDEYLNNETSGFPSNVKSDYYENNECSSSETDAFQNNVKNDSANCASNAFRNNGKNESLSL